SGKWPLGVSSFYRPLPGAAQPNERCAEGKDTGAAPCPSLGGPGTTSPRRRVGKINLESLSGQEFNMYKIQGKMTMSDSRRYNRNPSSHRGGVGGAGPPAAEGDGPGNREVIRREVQ